MKTVFLDSETCGFHGLPVLLQYAVDDGPVQIVHLWKTPTYQIVDLIHFFVDNRIVAHNLRFDFFHLSKLYNLCTQCLGEKTLSDYPVDHIAEWEYNTRNGVCLKPAAAVDTLLFAQRGAAQAAVMESKPVYVRRVYRPIAESVRQELENRTDLPWILFANRSDPNAPKWSICERKDELTGEVEASWVDLKLSFAPSNGLKHLSKFLLGYEPPANFDEIAIDEQYHPAEEGYAPFAVLLREGDDWSYKGKPTWPAVIHKHIEHWATDHDALQYATEDINMLRGLYEYFGSPEDDKDSMLAAQVASVRLRGFAIDVPAMAQARADSQAIIDAAQLNVNSPPQVKGFISEALDPMEQVIVANGCDKHVLKQLCKEFTLEEQEECYCEGGKLPGDFPRTGPLYKECPRCNGVGTVGPGPMPVVERAHHIEEVRKHIKRVELYNKLLQAGRAYPDFNVIGAKSGRMSGASGLNFQGVASDSEVRSLFTLADEDWVLAGGDYDSQELAILATTSNDMDLLNDIKGGKSLHGLMAAELFETTYEDIMENKNTDPEDRYARAKSAVYLMAYGGTVETMARNLGLELEVCQRGFNNFLSKYANMGVARAAIKERFTALRREDQGFTFKIPAEPFVETIFGFRRYFDNEYAILGSIFKLASNLPDHIRYAGQGKRSLMVQRTEGKVQTVGGATCSALYGAAHSIQNRIIRAAMNHLIQSVGRTLTLGLQYNIWECQPQGIHAYKLAVMGVHDESLVACRPDAALEIREKVRDTLRSQAEDIPLIAMSWATGVDSWYGVKKASADTCDDFVPCGFAEEVAA